MATLASVATAEEGEPDSLIIDTHQHLWELGWQQLPWLAAGDDLARDFTTRDYLEATAGRRVKAVYMEVDVAPAQKRSEVEHIVKLCRDPAAPTVAAVVGGAPDSDGFADYVRFLAQFPEVKGVRQVLHGAHPKGRCLTDAFVAGVRLLGERGLSFDLCMRSTDLADGLKLTELAPDTRFVLDHCGNQDPKALRSDDAAVRKEVDTWRRDIAALAKRPNVIGKISGVIANSPRVEPGAATSDGQVSRTAELLGPVVRHCLDSFGSERVVFGGDWPVCLKGAPLSVWIRSLRQIIADRPADERRRLWSQNAIRFYGLQL